MVNNAGVRGNHFYDDFLTLEDYKAVWEVNVYGAIRVTQTFKDLIKQSRSRYHFVLARIMLLFLLRNLIHTCRRWCRSMVGLASWQFLPDQEDAVLYFVRLSFSADSLTEGDSCFSEMATI